MWRIGMISRKLLAAIKLHTEPAYRLAQKARVNPSVLSKLMRGYTPVVDGDERIMAVGELLGFSPNDCFEKEDSQ
jgi:hypothetical protein